MGQDPGGDGLFIDQGAVVAAQILQYPGIILPADLGMTAGDGKIVEHYIVVIRPSERGGTA
jgi:hypothetical protein